MTNEKTNATGYLEFLAKQDQQIVDVRVPSGYVFRMRQPNTLGTFLDGELPQTAANKAAEEWAEQGVGPKPDAEQALDQNDIQVKRVLEIRDRTIALSYSPKIVIGPANHAADELSTSEIPDRDLSYLFKWTAAGGSGEMMTAMFPETTEQRVMAGIDGKKLRKARKRTGKAKSAV